jgi:hypothetical protein
MWMRHRSRRAGSSQEDEEDWKWNEKGEWWGFHLGATALAAPASSSAMLCNEGGKQIEVGLWEEMTMLCYCYESVDGPGASGRRDTFALPPYFASLQSWFPILLVLTNLVNSASICQLLADELCYTNTWSHTYMITYFEIKKLNCTNI